MAKRNKSKPYGRTTWNGQVIDNRTASALKWVQRKAGIPVVVVQGSYKAGNGASASAGTHDKGGVVDCSVNGLSRKQRIRLVRALKQAGFAAWYRRPMPGVWGPHIHAVLRGHRNLAPGAAAQVPSYDAHRNGLANNAYDRTWRPKRPRRWSHRRNRPIVK